MDVSALEAASRALEKSLDFWGAMLLVATCLVVIGLVFEYWHEIRGFIGEVTRPAAAFPRTKFAEMTGAFLVTLGVAGELLFTYQASRVETKLRDNNYQIEAMLTKEAGDAKASANEAASAASRAKDDSGKATTAASNALLLASGARREADSFEKDIVSAKTQAAEAESHLADALQRAADAEKEVVRLNGMLADRQLTDLQLQLIAGKLSRYSGQEYTVTAYWESKESLGIANRIHASLQLAKWSYSAEGSKSQMLGGVIGVFVWTHPDADEATKEAADSLVDALNAEGIEAAREQQNPKNPKTDMININVGAKR